MHAPSKVRLTLSGDGVRSNLVGAKGSIPGRATIPGFQYSPQRKTMTAKLAKMT